MTFDSAADNVFKMYGRSGDTYRGFGESPRGLYYSCMKESATVLTINTVEGKNEIFKFRPKKG